jgi:hypothetical protein
MITGNRLSSLECGLNAIPLPPHQPLFFTKVGYVQNPVHPLIHVINMYYVYIYIWLYNIYIYCNILYIYTILIW